MPTAETSASQRLLTHVFDGHSLAVTDATLICLAAWVAPHGRPCLAVLAA